MGVTEAVMLDRRVRRTRRALHDALVELAQQDGVHAVTVDEIAARADVSRATFYAHYADKAALLEAVSDALWDDLEQSMGVSMDSAALVRTGASVAALFEHARAHRDVYQVVVGPLGDIRVAGQFRTRMGRRIQRGLELRNAELGATPRLPAGMLAQLWAVDVVSVLAWWLEGSMHAPLDDVVVQLLERVLYGDNWANGLARDALVVDEPAVRRVLRES